MQRPLPKSVRTYCGGEAAKPPTQKPYNKFKDNGPFKPRQRKSDGPPSKVLHVYRIRLSTTEAQMRALFEPFGEVTRIILYKPQFAYVVFKWVSDAQDAKQALDLQKTTSDGSYIDVVLRAVQFTRGCSAKMGERPYDKLRIDFVDPALPLPEQALKNESSD